MIRWIAAIAVVLGCGAASPARSTLLPDLHYPLLDGGTWASAESRGKIVVLDVWATYCKPCKDAFPRLGRLAQAHPEVVVIGLSVDEADDVVRAYLRAVPATFPIARDRDLSISRPPMKVAELPTLLVIDRAGMVRLRRADATIADYDALPALLDRLAAEP
jgi:thiol-disulfide isomerase/thioredoxin